MMHLSGPLVIGLILVAGVDAQTITTNAVALTDIVDSAPGQSRRTPAGTNLTAGLNQSASSSSGGAGTRVALTTRPNQSVLYEIDQGGSAYATFATLYASSGSGGSSGNQTLLTLTASQQVWGRIEIRMTGGVQSGSSSATVDVGNDGSMEFQGQIMGPPFPSPNPVTVPVTFGPGTLDIRTVTSGGCTASCTFQCPGFASYRGELDVEFLPEDRCTWTSYASACGVNLAATTNFLRGVDLTATSLVPVAPAFIVLGARRVILRIPFPPGCFQHTEIIAAVPIASGTSGTGTLVLNGGALGPIAFRAQAASLDPVQGMVLTSNPLHIVCQ